MTYRMRIAALLAHGFSGGVLSTCLATVLLELHPIQLVRRGELGVLTLLAGPRHIVLFLTISCCATFSRSTCSSLLLVLLSCQDDVR